MSQILEHVSNLIEHTQKELLESFLISLIKDMLDEFSYEKYKERMLNEDSKTKETLEFLQSLSVGPLSRKIAKLKLSRFEELHRLLSGLHTYALQLDAPPYVRDDLESRYKSILEQLSDLEIRINPKRNLAKAWLDDHGYTGSRVEEVESTSRAVVLGYKHKEIDLELFTAILGGALEADYQRLGHPDSILFYLMLEADRVAYLITFDKMTDKDLERLQTEVETYTRNRLKDGSDVAK